MNQMKKALVFLFIVFCIAFAVEAQDIVNLKMDRAQMGLRGAVASMDEDIMMRKDYFREDWPERKWFVKDLRSILREEDGRIMTFNPAGRMLTITYTHQGRHGRTTTCTYASNGLLSSFAGEGYKVVAQYSGNYADINVYAETKDYKTPNLDKADLNNTPYSFSYPFDLKCRQQLSEEGLVQRSEYYYVDSMPAKVCEYVYNHNGLLVSEKLTEYSMDEKSVTTVKYVYDNRGFLTKKTTHGRALDETRSYENNEWGDCTKMTVERPYGTVVYTFDYVYDSMGNWTVRLQFEDGVFDNAAIRTLTYHKTVQEKPAKPAKDVKKEKPAKDMTADEKRAEKERVAAEKKAAKEAEAERKAAAKAEQEKVREAEKNMTKEERKAAELERKAVEQAEKERIATEKKAEKERIAAEKERMAAEKKAEKERIAAEKKAFKEREAAEKKALKERKAAEKKAIKEKEAAEKKAKK